MQLDVGSEPTLRLVYVTCLNLNLERFTHQNNFLQCNNLWTCICDIE